jgi:hypothetical protein
VRASATDHRDAEDANRVKTYPRESANVASKHADEVREDAGPIYPCFVHAGELKCIILFIGCVFNSWAMMHPGCFHQNLGMVDDSRLGGKQEGVKSRIYLLVELALDRPVNQVT